MTTDRRVLIGLALSVLGGLCSIAALVLNLLAR